MTHFLLALAFLTSAFAARPRFHCYTYPDSVVSAYQSPAKCGGKNKMEIVCTYSAGCKPTNETGPAPERSAAELAVMFSSNELKGSFLVCKGKGEIKDNQIVRAECPKPDACRADGMYTGVAAGMSITTENVVSEPGGPRATR